MDDIEGGNQSIRNSSSERIYKLMDYSLNLDNILRFYYCIKKWNYFKPHT